MLERTLVLLKPDCVQRGLAGEVIRRFEQKGLQIVGLKMRQFPRALIEKHYEVHKAQKFYGSLVEFMTSGPVVAIAIQGKDAVEVVRGLMGKTNSRQSPPGTIRGDLGMSFSNNLVHGSDGPESARRELELFFGEPGDLCEWTPVGLPWVYNVKEELR